MDQLSLVSIMLPDILIACTCIIVILNSLNEYNDYSIVSCSVRCSRYVTVVLFTGARPLPLHVAFNDVTNPEAATSLPVGIMRGERHL